MVHLRHLLHGNLQLTAGCLSCLRLVSAAQPLHSRCMLPDWCPCRQTPHLQTASPCEAHTHAQLKYKHTGAHDQMPTTLIEVQELAQQQLTPAKCQSHSPHIIIAVGKRERLHTSPPISCNSKG